MSTNRDSPCFDVIKSTWPIFHENLLMTLGSSAVVWLIPAIISGLVLGCVVFACIVFGGAAVLQLKPDVGPNAIQQTITTTLLPLAGILIVGMGLYALTFFAIFNFMSIGWKQILLALVAGKPAKFSALFNIEANGKLFWKLLITNVLVSLAIGAGLACLVIPGVFIAVRLCLAPFLVIHRDLGPIDAMRTSHQLITGYSWQIILLFLLLNVVLSISTLFLKLSALLTLVLLVALPGFHGLVLARIYLMRTEGIELQPPQFILNADQQSAVAASYSSPPSEITTDNVNRTPPKAKGLREPETAVRGNEVLGIVCGVSIILILGLGGAFVYGVSVGQNEQAAPGLRSGSVETPTRQAGSDAIPANVVAPTPVSSSPGTPSRTSDYLSDTVPYTEAQLVDRFVRFKVDSSLGQSKLQLELLAPKDWCSKEVIISKQQMAKGALHPLELAELSCATRNTSLEAWYMPASADQAVTLDKCFGDYCQSNGFSVVAQSCKPNRIDAIIKYTPTNMKPMVARIAFIRVGYNIIWLAGCAPQSEFGNWSNVFCVAAASFSPVGYNAAIHPDVTSRTVPGSKVSQ